MQRLYNKTRNGFCELPFMVDDSGKVYPCNIENDRVYQANEMDRSAKFVSINYNEKSKSASNMKNYAAPVGVNLTESPTGQIGRARTETAGVAGTRRPLRIILDNTEATEQTVVVGDGHGLFSTKNGIGAKAAGVIVGGTYGTLTLDRLEDICKSSPFDLHGYHILNTTSAGASSEGFLSAGQVTQFLIAPDVQIVREVEIPIADEVEQSAQKDNIRSNRAYRFHLNGFSGWKFVIPAGEKIVFTLRQIMAVGVAKDMVLLDEIAG